MIATLVILGLTAVGSVVAMVVATKAPMGYQDETGFHYASEKTAVEAEASFDVNQPTFA